jgi:hypothetical protein
MFVRTESTPDAETARLALERAGIAVTGQMVEGDLGETWTFPVAAPGGDVNAVQAKLRAARFFGAAVAPRIAVHEGKFADLSVAAGSVKLADRTVATGDVERLVVYTRPGPLPADAVVLLDGETPDGFWYMPYLVGVLALLSAFMVWAFLRGLLRKPEPPPPAPRQRPQLKAV